MGQRLLKIVVSWKFCAFLACRRGLVYVRKTPPTFALALAACGGQQAGRTGVKDDRCTDFEVEVEHIWSTAIKAEVLGRGGSVEAIQRDKVANRMDQISEDWVRLRTSVCRDHFVRNVITADDYRTRSRCLDDSLDRQRRLVTLLKGGDLASSEKLANSLLEARNECNR